MAVRQVSNSMLVRSRCARPQSAIVWLGLSLLGAFLAPAQAEVPVPLFLRSVEWMDGPVLQAPTLGPDQLPHSLSGMWRVSLCIKQGLSRGHSWIRYESVTTGEVHTIGKFRKGVPEIRHRVSRAVLYPAIDSSGLYWDYDIRHEHEVRKGNYVVGSVFVADPIIYLGEDAHGHGLVRDNCVTYARDAWYHYSRQWYDLSLIHTPNSLLSIAHKDTPDPPFNEHGPTAILTR